MVSFETTIIIFLLFHICSSPVKHPASHIHTLLLNTGGEGGWSVLCLKAPSSPTLNIDLLQITITAKDILLPITRCLCMLMHACGLGSLFQ